MFVCWYVSAIGLWTDYDGVHREYPCISTAHISRKSQPRGPPHTTSIKARVTSFKEPNKRFQGINSTSLCSLAGRCDNPIPTRFLYPLRLFINSSTTIAQCLSLPADKRRGCTKDDSKKCVGLLNPIFPLRKRDQWRTRLKIFKNRSPLEGRNWYRDLFLIL